MSAARDLFVTASDGLRLHAVLRGPEGGAALPLVCLPGLTRSAADFRPFLDAFEALDGGDRPLLAVDYRGRGLSGRDPDPARYTVAVETEDLLAVLAAAGIGRAVFVGTSRGGLITMGLAAARPDLIAGAVLNDIGPVIELAGLLRIKGYVGTATPVADHAAGAAWLRGRFRAEFPALLDTDWRLWAEAAWRAGPDGLVPDHDPALARTLDGLASDTVLPDLWPAFEALAPVPVLAIRGALSDLLSSETLLRMTARHPDLDVLTVPGQGHAPLLHGPETVARIAALVRRAEARPAPVRP